MDIRERAAFESSQVASMIRGGGLHVEVLPSKDFSTEEMILNIGPQHPSTHGVLRVILELDGEVITKAEPVIGYMHGAAEKLAEYRDARQALGPWGEPGARRWGDHEGGARDRVHAWRRREAGRISRRSPGPRPHEPARLDQ